MSEQQAAVFRELAYENDVRRELERGRLWRAKEILRGRVGEKAFDPALYEQYGAVLLAMQDELQAGRYLFLSGARRPEYEVAIATYLERHDTGHWRRLVGSFTNRVKARTPNQLPPAVREHLLAKGYPVSRLDDTPLSEAEIGPAYKARFTVQSLGCALAVLFVLWVLIAGFLSVTRTLDGWLS